MTTKELITKLMQWPGDTEVIVDENFSLVAVAYDRQARLVILTSDSDSPEHEEEIFDCVDDVIDYADDPPSGGPI